MILDSKKAVIFIKRPQQCIECNKKEIMFVRVKLFLNELVKRF